MLALSAPGTCTVPAVMLSRLVACLGRPLRANETRNEERVGPASIKGNQPSRISFFLPEDKGDPTMPKNGKIPTHDISRKDTANMNSMEFNETLTICSSLLAKSIAKVSSDYIVF